jgi:hypothetical protein
MVNAARRMVVVSWFAAAAATVAAAPFCDSGTTCMLLLLLLSPGCDMLVHSSARARTLYGTTAVHGAGNVLCGRCECIVPDVSVCVCVCQYRQQIESVHSGILLATRSLSLSFAAVAKSVPESIVCTLCVPDEPHLVVIIGVRKKDRLIPVR